MIHCNLNVLMAQRNLKITDVHNATGLSRTTLTSLAYGHAKGIQFDTLSTLCDCLQVSPYELLLDRLVMEFYQTGMQTPGKILCPAWFSCQKILNRTFPLRKKPVIPGNLRKRHFQV